MNGIVSIDDLNTHIANEINVLYKINIYKYLNADAIFSTAQLTYHYQNVTMGIQHSLKSIEVS